MFITFEGPDGCGKTTQARLLVRFLKERGASVVHTFEPGATGLGRELRRLLLEPGRHLSPVAELLLLAADRAQHVDEVIRPALKQGAVVVCERYVDSSIAYQGGGLGLAEEDIRRVNDVATGGLSPDLTILLDLDPAGSFRKGAVQDRIEGRGLEFQRRVWEAYRRLALDEPARFVSVKVEGRGVDAVQADIRRIVMDRLAKRGMVL
ncbi:MAG: dTMP kinase [Firmicutes bacterium]|nr:dTMP kinase [Bacillota bacterium]